MCISFKKCNCKKKTQDMMKLTQAIIDSNFTKLILQDANLPLILFLQDVVNESRFASSKEAGNDCDRGEFVFIGHGGNLWECGEAVRVRGEGIFPPPPKTLLVYYGQFEVLSLLSQNCDKVRTDLSHRTISLWSVWSPFTFHLWRKKSSTKNKR